MRTLIVLGLFALCACSQQVPQAPPEWMTPQWKSLADGSQYTEVRDENGNQAVKRCWPETSDEYLCLAVGRLAAMGALTIVSEHENALPDLVLPYVSAHDGYSCGTVLGPREEIEKGGETLVSNEPNYRNSRWSSGYVARYMDDNAIEGVGHFQCLEILEAVLKGSLATVGSTSVKLAMVKPS